MLYRLLVCSHLCGSREATLSGIWYRRYKLLTAGSEITDLVGRQAETHKILPVSFAQSIASRENFTAFLDSLLGTHGGLLGTILSEAQQSHHGRFDILSVALRGHG